MHVVKRVIIPNSSSAGQAGLSVEDAMTQASDHIHAEKKVPEAELEKGDDKEPFEAYSVFASWQKRSISSVICFSAMFSGLSSFIYYPAITALSRDLHVSIELINLTITSYLIVSGIAPSILGDVADQTGRRPVSLLAFSLYFAANIGLALQDKYAALVVLRCIQSAGASGTLAIAYGVISDIATPAERGGYVGVLMGFTNAAPCLGPVLGGVLTQELSWRWIFWILSMLSGAHLVGLFLLLPETSRKLIGNGSKPSSRLMSKPIFAPLCPTSALKCSDAAGPKVAFRFPNPLSCVAALFQKGTFLVLLSGGITYTVFSCLATSLSSQMIHLYNLDYLTAGLVYLPSGIGGILAAYTTGKVLDRDYHNTARTHNLPIDRKSINANNLANYPIEKARLRSAFILFVISATSTIGYGWALQRRTHIAVPLVLQFFSGGTQVSIFVVAGTLLTDLNPDRSATVQASYNLVRCGLGAGGVAALQTGIDAIGVGWMFTIYGVVAFCCIPLCWWLRQSGWDWRKAKAAKI
jgi:multidrug resistance protein